MNMSLRGVVLATLSVFALAGCDESRVVGTLTTSTTLRIVSPGGNKQVLAAGSYRTAIRAQEKGGQAFITANGKEVTFKIPQQLNGTGDQTIKISPATMRQEFGLNGRVYGTKIPFDRTVERSCIYDVRREWECHRNNKGERECDWVTREIPGHQRVRETGFTSYKTIDINLVNTAGQKVGNFRGSVSLGETIIDIDYLTGCMPDWHRPY